MKEEGLRLVMTADKEQKPKTKDRQFPKAWLLVGIGLGGYLGWFVSILIRGGVMSGPWGADGRSQVFDPFFLVATFTATIVCLVQCLPVLDWRRRWNTKGSRALIVIVACLSLLGTVVLGLFPFTEIAVCYVLAVCVGIGIGVLIMLWLMVLSDFDPRSTVIILLFDVLVALTSFFLVHLSEKGLRLSWLTVTISSLLLLISCICILVAMRLFPPDEPQATEPNPLLGRFVCFSFASSFIVEFTSIFAVEHNIEGFFVGTTQRFTVQSFGCLFCAAVILGLLLVLWKAKSKPGFIVSILYRLTVLVLLLGVGLVLTQEPGMFFASDGMLLLSRCLCLIVVWAIALHAVYSYGSDVVELIGAMLVAQFFGYFAGHALHDLVEPMLTSSLLAAWVIIGILFLWCITFLFVFTNHEVYSGAKVSVDMTIHGSTLQERCAQLQKRYALTEREREVLELLACGRNAVSIQEILVVSYNTVKAHKRNIYVKLGVHSQQELLTLVENTEPEAH